MGSKAQSAVCCLDEFCFLQFSIAQVLVWLRKQFINNFVFPAWASAPGYNNNNNSNNRNVYHYKLLGILRFSI